MKRIIDYVIIAMTIVFVLISVGIVIQNKDLKKEIEVYDNNFKALNLENSALKDEIVAYKFNVEQLEFINDSIITDLNNTRKELGIKDKQLKQMQNIKTEVITKDSIFIKDTIFRDSFVKLDTTLTNKWYDIQVELQYPNKIDISTTYRTDLSVFAYSSKEILGTPKKCALGRLFQKKYNVIRVEVHDANPFSEIKESKFIIIE